MLSPFRLIGFACLTGLICSLSAQDKSPLPGVVLKGHTAAIYSVAYNSTGSMAVTGSFDKSIRLWDPATGKLIREYSGTTGHQSLVLSTVFNPAGDRIASGGSDNFARVWDVPLSTPVRDLLHAAGVNSVAVSPDGKILAGGTKDGTVRLWQAIDGKLLFTLSGHEGEVTSVSFNSNGQLLCTSGVDGTVRFWNPVDGKAQGVIGAHATAVAAAAITPANNFAYSIGHDGLLKFWQLPVASSKPLPPHAAAVAAMVLSPDGNSALTGAADKSVKLANVGNGALIREFAGASAAVSSVDLWPNGSTVMAGSVDGKVSLWNNADGKLLAQINTLSNVVTGVAANPNNAGFVTVGSDGVIRNWNFPIVPTRSLVHPDKVLAAKLSNDGARLITGSSDKIVRTWTVANGAAERQFTGSLGAVHAVSLTLDGTTAIGAGADAMIRLWTAANGTSLATWAGHSGPVNTLAVNPNGASVVSGGEDGFVKIWALPAVPPKIYLHPDAVTGMVMSPDGNRVLTVANDKQARIWNLAVPNPERAYNLNGQVLTASVFSGDNVTVALCTADKILSIRNGDQEVKKITLPAEARSVVFAPNGASVGVGLADNSIHFYTIADGKESKVIPGHTGAVSYLRYSPKGDYLVSVGADKTLRLWNADFTAKAKFDLPGVPQVAALSYDGLKLVVGMEKNLAVLTVADGKSVLTSALPSVIRGVSFSPDATKVAVAGADNKVSVLGPDGKLLETFVHEGAVSGVAFVPDAKRIISSSADKSLRVWTQALIAQAAHTGPVRQVALTPAGDKIVSVGDDKTIRIWNALTAKEILAVPGSTEAMTGLSMSLDGTKAATVGAEKMAKIWTVLDGKTVQSIPLAGPGQAVALSPNGLRLAVAYSEGSINKIRIFDALTSRELQALPDATAPIRSLSFLPDNRTLIASGDDKNSTIYDVPVISATPIHAGGVVAVAMHPGAAQAITAGGDKTVRLWDLTTGKELKTILTLPEGISSLAISRDFAYVAIGLSKSAKIVQIADGKEVANIPHTEAVVSISFSADRLRLITGSADKVARIFEVATGKLMQSVSHQGVVRGVALHPSQPLIVTASEDKTTVVTPFVFNRVVAASPLPLRAITVTANGSHVIATGDDKIVHAFNAASGAEERKFEGSEGAIYAVTVSKNLQMLAAAGADKTIRVYNFNDAKLIGSFVASGPVKGLAFSANGLMLVSTSEDKSITAWNVTNVPGQPLTDDFGKVIQQFAHTDVATSVAIAEKGEVYTASLDKSIKQWKVASPAPTHNFQMPNLVDAVAWSPDGKFLAAGCHTGSVRIHDVEKNAMIKEFVAHGKAGSEAPIYSIAWSPDGKQILTTSFDKSLKLWDSTSGTLVKEFKPFVEKTFEKGHGDQVFCGTFTKDGKFIVSGSSDRKIKMWSVADGSVVREFANPNIKGEVGQSHPSGIYSLRFTPDEKSLVSVGPAPRNQGYIAVWNVADGRMLSGNEVPYGHIFSVAVSLDGKNLLLGCGPRTRQDQEADALIIPFPPAK